jgi:hypothetical protein
MSTAAAALGVLSALVLFPLHEARAQAVVFQAAGPDAASILGTVEAFRTALGALNTGPASTSGRREINWDGGGVDTTTPPMNPFNVFLDSRGAQFTTPGEGLSQAPPSGGPQGGLAGALLFNNPTYGTTFKTFSPQRLFTPVGSRITDAFFFVPGTNGGTPALVTGFGAVFTDVDQPNGGKQSKPSTKIDYFDADGKLIFTGKVASAPGDGNLSFFGLMFEGPAQIARVRITTGDVKPGPDDGAKDIVMMDDFIYGEPHVPVP